MARRYGATQAEIDSLSDIARSGLPEAEREALGFAERVTREPGALGEADIARLRAHWSTDQIVEMTCVIGMFNYLNRFAEAMGLWPTRPGEGGPEGEAA